MERSGADGGGYKGDKMYTKKTLFVGIKMSKKLAGMRVLAYL